MVLRENVSTLEIFVWILTAVRCFFKIPRTGEEIALFTVPDGILD